MSRRERPLPACYALTAPGLESVAAEEIERDLGGEIKKTSPGVVVFRVDEIDDRLRTLRTTEDVFLLAWGTDQLTYRAADLDSIQHWTARKPEWPHLLQLHHALRPKPKGRPTYRLVTQMEGHHAYQRRDAGQALARGLTGVIPDSWRSGDDNASIEIWLSIDEATAVCGLRLSDRTMRHRTYKLEHRPASLRPTVAAALVRLAEIRPRQVVLDPMCGAGTLLAEYLMFARRWKGVTNPPALGGDIEWNAVRAAAANLRRLGASALCRGDATRLPLPDACVDRILCNPPFGKQLSDPAAIRPLYQGLVTQLDRVLKPGGVAVLIVSDPGALGTPARQLGWKLSREVKLRVLGQIAFLSVWRKPP
jgi:tRNA (guanine6-N2)-methyltransferase